MNCIVMIGRVSGGFTCWGPFDTEYAAEQFIERALRVNETSYCEVVRLNAPPR